MIPIEEQKKLMQSGRYDLIDFSIITNPSYQVNWHHEEIAEELRAAAKGEADWDILLLEIPPRHGKSEEATINFPAWILGLNPKAEVITASYSGDLATDFGSKTRDIINKMQYQNIFTTRLKADERSKGHWKTEEGGGYTSVGVGGALTGRGANWIIVDDPIKNREEADSMTYRDKVWSWFTSTLWTRREPGAKVIVILTRWHKDDLAGRLLENAEFASKIKEIKFPAIAINDEKFRKKGDALWPERYSLEELESTKKAIGPYDFSSLYQQEPITSANQEFKPEWFHERSEMEVLKLDTRRFLTVDTAYKQKEVNDYCGFCSNFVDKENKWNLKLWHLRMNPDDLINYLFALQLRYRFEKIGLERTAFTEGLKPALDMEQRKRGMILPIVMLEHHQVNKEVRIRGLIPLYAAGSINHISGECKDGEDELLTFPKGVHDDVCLIAGTKILTRKGQMNIEDIKSGEMVMTRSGYKKVIWSGITGIKPTISNIGITGTANHPVITVSGIKDLQYCNEYDILYVWNKYRKKIEMLSYTEARSIIDIPCQKDLISAKVYNLEVEDAHEFFANNILVHNCDAESYQLQIAQPPQNGNLTKPYDSFQPISRYQGGLT